MKNLVTLPVVVAIWMQVLEGPSSSMQAQETKPPLVPTIKEIMREAHQCRTAYIRDIRTELDKAAPNWELIETRSRELIRAGKLLALNSPPQGSSESWEKLTNLYVARATVLVAAAERKDEEEGRLVAKRMVSMCATCHRAHR